MASTSVLVPLYIYPLKEIIPAVWAPLINAIRRYPNLHFIVVINPNSGPDSRPDLPDEQYQRALPYLQGFPNVTLVGYILTWYGKREINVAKTDIDAYWNWDGITKEKGVRPMGLDGIFVDEVTCNGENMEYYETLYSYIKSKMWRSGSPGYVLLNPGCAPRHDAYYNICDLVIVFEHFHNNFMNPPLDDWAFQHLVDHCADTRVDGTHSIIMEDQTNGTPPMASEPVDERLFDSPTPVSDSPIPGVSVHGMKLMLPKSSDAAPISKFGLMDHDFLPGKSQDDKVAALKSLVFDLVQVKRIGAIFITDIEIGKGDIYANWSSFWREFIDFVAEANCIAPDYDV